MDLSKKLGDKIDDNAGVIVKALAQNLSHQHSKVRKITIEVRGKNCICRQNSSKI